MMSKYGENLYNGKPIFENQVGIYQDGKAWVVGHMREKGEMYEIGRFMNEKYATKVANDYIDQLKDIGMM